MVLSVAGNIEVVVCSTSLEASTNLIFVLCQNQLHCMMGSLSVLAFQFEQVPFFGEIQKQNSLSKLGCKL